jgi:arylsulfatase A-like enzyme
MSMLTGLYPAQHGRDLPWRLMQRVNHTFDRQPRFQSLADRLAARGYDTAAFVGKGSISAPFGLAKGFKRYEEHGGVNLKSQRRETNDLPQVEHKVQAWLSAPRAAPFFLFLHTYDVHEPRAAELAEDRAALEHVDGFVARLTARLRELGIYDNTLIILTGDHGSRMIDIDGKCCMHGVGHYEENVRVPFIVKLPGPARGANSPRLVRHVDILPTVLDLVDEPRGSYAGPGVSFLPRLSLRDGEADPVSASFSEADGACAARRALVTARWKYIYTPADLGQFLLAGTNLFYGDRCPAACKTVPAEELYDLHADPTEQRNLLLAPLAPEAAAALEQLRVQMEAHLNLPRHYQTVVYTARAARAQKQSRTEIDPSVREAMRALGYGD